MVTIAWDILAAQVEPSAVAERIRTAIQRRQSSAYKLQRATGIDTREIRKLRDGTHKRGTSLPTILAVARALDVAPEWLAFGVGDGP